MLHNQTPKGWTPRNRSNTTLSGNQGSPQPGAPRSQCKPQRHQDSENWNNLRREFSLMSRPEALQYREACLKYTVKKSERHFFLSNAFMASARSFTMFWCMLQIGINWLIKSCVGRLRWNGLKSKLVEDRYIVLCTVTFITRSQSEAKQPKHQKPPDKKQQNRNTNTHKTKTKQTKNNNHNRAVMWQIPVNGWQG